jgi:putative PEP-CTERM system TPR-repeat lipoprotein
MARNFVARRAVRPLIAALLVAVLAGCSSESADKLLSSAKSYLERGDNRAATIQLKNALQKDPDLAEARFLFGKLLLKAGDAVAAIVELRKASELNYPADQVMPLLAKALLDSGQPHKVMELDEANVLNAPEAIADFKTTLAIAYGQEGNVTKAEAALNDALRAKSDHAPALLYSARILASKKDLEGATKLVDAVLARTPADASALVVKGDLQRMSRNDAAAAIASYRKALVAAPDDVLASTALIEQLLAQNDLEGARVQIEAMKKVRPRHPNTIYFQSRLAAQKGELQVAEELVLQLLKVAPDDPQVLQLGGIIALQRGDLLVAQTRLGHLVQQSPRSATARQMLARAYLRAGDAAKSIEVLDPLLQSATPDAQTLNIAAGANLLSGDLKKAQQLFSRAARSDPSGTRGPAGAALSRIMGGDAQGLPDLQAIASNDRGIDTDMTLISALMSRRDYDGALKAIDQLDKKSPGKPLAPHLRGQALALRGDLSGARASFEKALAADPSYFPAIDRLAVLDWRDKKPDAARARFEAVLKANPNDVRAMVGLANLEERSGKPKQEVAALFAKAVSVKPGDAWLRAQLIQYHLSKQDFKLALNAAQDAVSALRNDQDMLALLAASQLAAGETNQAISSYGTLASLRPRSPAPLLGLADAHIANKSYDAAAAAVKKAEALAPDSPAVIVRAAKIDMLTGHADAALSRTRALQARAPKAADGFVIEGDLASSRKDWPAATAAYRAALQREPAATPVAQRLYLALRASGDKARTDAFAAEWTKARPADSRFLFFLAGVSIADRKYDQAETQLKQVLRLDPDNPTAVNNLAWVLWAQKKPGALEAAERANQLAPDQPMFMDTLALVLGEQGQLPRALELQKRAVALKPDAPGLRLTLARLEARAGNKTDARKELDELAKLGDKFSQQGEVRELLGQL